MACALADWRGAPAGSGEPAFKGRPRANLDFAHTERIELIPSSLFARIRNGGFEDLFDQARGFAGSQRQDVQGIPRGSPTDRIGHLPCLAG
jgi:hypothetical protein